MAVRPVDEPFGHESFDPELMIEGLKVETFDEPQVESSLRAERAEGKKGLKSFLSLS